MRDRMIMHAVWERMGIDREHDHADALRDPATRRQPLPGRAVLEDRAELQEARPARCRRRLAARRSSPRSASSSTRTRPTPRSSTSCSMPCSRIAKSRTRRAARAAAGSGSVSCGRATAICESVEVVRPRDLDGAERREVLRCTTGRRTARHHPRATARPPPRARPSTRRGRGGTSTRPRTALRTPRRTSRRRADPRPARRRLPHLDAVRPAELVQPRVRRHERLVDPPVRSAPGRAQPRMTSTNAQVDGDANRRAARRSDRCTISPSSGSTPPRVGRPPRRSGRSVRPASGRARDR